MLSLILASASPRRKELLQVLGLTPSEILAPKLDETPFVGELPSIYAKRLALAKAQTIAARRPESLILGADTVVALGRRILPKAESRQEAAQCLEALSGRRHRVYGALALLSPGGQVQLKLSTTRVLFKRLSRAEIAAYLASDDWQGKAGGYAIQGKAQAFIPWINGSYSNVVGLDTALLAQMLTAHGIVLPCKSS